MSYSPASVSPATLTNTGDLYVASAASTVTRLAAGTSGYVLTSNGANTQPTYQAVAVPVTTLIKWGM